MDEDTLDAASSAVRSDNEIATIEEQSGSAEIILSSSERAKRRIHRQQRQITRLKESLSYRIGRHITIAVESTWRIPFLPITFPVYVFLLGLESYGPLFDDLGFLCYDFVHGAPPATPSNPCLDPAV